MKQTAFVALFDISLLVLIGISCITISSVETKNFNTLPKTRWVVVVIFAYLTFVLSGMSTFFSYSTWHIANAPDFGIGKNLRNHRGMADGVMKCQRIFQATISLIVFILILVSPFYQVYTSAVVCCVISFLQMVLASVEFGASIIDKDKRKKYFGEDKVHFFVFLACDVISMVSMCLLGLGIGDVLKSDTALAASGLCFILFVSYAITTVLLFLALNITYISSSNLSLKVPIIFEILWIPFFLCRYISKPCELWLKEKFHSTNRTIAMLASDEFCNAFVFCLSVVVLISINHYDHIRMTF